MKRYTHLLFDADGTLLDFAAAERAALRDTLAVHGIAVTPDVAAAYHAINDAIWRQIETGEFDRANLNAARFGRLAERYGFTYDPVALGDEYFSHMAQNGQLIEGALALCRDLARRYTLAIVTNGTARVQHGRLDGTPLMETMSYCFISEEIGAEKPSPAFFAAVAAAIPDFAPETALVIGDSLSSDIAGGIAAGIDTVWYNPAGKSAPAHCTPTYTVSDYAALRTLLHI